MSHTLTGIRNNSISLTVSDHEQMQKSYPICSYTPTYSIYCLLFSYLRSATTISHNFFHNCFHHIFPLSIYININNFHHINTPMRSAYQHNPMGNCQTRPMQHQTTPSTYTIDSILHLSTLKYTYHAL